MATIADSVQSLRTKLGAQISSKNACSHGQCSGRRGLVCRHGFAR